MNMLTLPPQTAEIIALLYEATQTPPAPSDGPVLNPTGGVHRREHLPSLKFQRDSTRPGGGVFVAKGPVAEKLKELPEGTIITADGSGDEGEAPTAVSSEARSNDDPLRSPLPHLSRSRSGPGSVMPVDAMVWSSSSAPVSASTSAPTSMVVDSAVARRGSSSSARQQLQQQHQQQQQAQMQDHPGQQSMVNFPSLGSGNFPNMNPALNNQMSAPENVQVMNLLDQTNAGNVLEQQAMADVGFLEGIPGTMFDWGAWPPFRPWLPDEGVGGADG